MVVLVAPEDRDLNEEEVLKDLQSASEWFAEHGKNTNTAIIGICKRALDLLNRKNAECKECGSRTSESIEKLQKQIAEKNAEIERLEKAIQVQEFMLENQDYKIKKAMSGAIESFADRLTKCFCNFPIWGKTAVNFIDQIAKEMGVM